MTSDVVCNPLPESLSGPCRRLRYHETNNSKVQSTLGMGSGETSTMTSTVSGSPLPESLYGPCRRLRYHETHNSKVQSVHADVKRVL